MSTYLLEIMIKIMTVICHMPCIIDIIKIYATELVVVFFNKMINPVVANFFFHYLLDEIHDILRSWRHSPLREVVDAINEHLLLRRAQYTIGSTWAVDLEAVLPVKRFLRVFALRPYLFAVT